MWVNVKTLDPSGPWSEASMQLWNDRLVQACQQYPNLRVFDWASVAQDGWFISDGIHYTPAGYAVRAHLIARALARAFPAPAQRELPHPLTALVLTRPARTTRHPGVHYRRRSGVMCVNARTLASPVAGDAKLS